MTKLFCFPYAGGSATFYYRWRQYLGSGIELVPVELAGRGRRVNDPLNLDVGEVVEEVLASIREDILGAPYALFGHSLGVSISYSLAQKIRQCSLPGPRHLFFSGRRAPHLKRNDEKMYHRMEDVVFRRELLALGGTPPEIFEQPELLEFFLPMLRNDFRMAETVDHTDDIHPLDGDISVLLGKEDDLTREQCEGWRLHTRRSCTIHYFEGGHFFLHHETERIVEIINKVLSS